MRRMTRLAAVAALVLFGVNCGGGGGNENNEPTPGNLSIDLISPNTDDGAVKLTITAPVPPTSITAAAAGIQVFRVGPIGTTTTVVVTGDLVAGPLLTIAVPDTRDDEDYSATILQVASRDYAVRLTTGYGFEINK